MDDRHADRTSRSWTHRALGAGGRALGSSHLGQDHLGTEALVAFVDGELSMGAHQRAAAHLAVCTECAADVQAQLQARSAVRAATTPCTPAGLLGALRQIPTASPPAALPTVPPRHGAVVQDGRGAWVAVLRPERFGEQAGLPGPTPDEAPRWPRRHR